MYCVCVFSFVSGVLSLFVSFSDQIFRDVMCGLRYICRR